MNTTPDLFIANLIRDYLADEDSIAAGVPNNETLPKVVMDTAKDPDMPSIVVAAKEVGNRGPRRTIEVQVLLLTRLKAGDVGAAVSDQFTTRAAASAWLEKIDERLRNKSALKTYIEALPDESRVGWTCGKLVHGGQAAPQRNASTGTAFYALLQTWELVWDNPPED